MGTFIVIYLLTLLCGYVFSVLISAVRYFPIVLFFTVLLPIMPFYVAYKNRKEHPTMAKFISIGWGIIYLIIAFIFYMDWS